MLNCGSTTNGDVFLLLLYGKFMFNVLFVHEITGNQRRALNSKVLSPWKCQIFVFYNFFFPIYVFVLILDSLFNFPCFVSVVYLWWYV